MSRYIIETEELTKKYGSHICVNHLNLHVPPEKIYGLLGRNGAGKTTAMKLLLNLSRPTDGRIFLFGEDYRKNSNKTYQRIGSMIESPGFYDNLTGGENLELLARLRGRHRKDTVLHALKTVGLEQENSKIFGAYSMGMKQRLGIAAAMMHEPELLILDEPINGLDPIGIHEIRSHLITLSREYGTTILISSHILSEIEQLAEMIGVMHEGVLLEETNMDTLRLRSRRYVEFEISDVNAATLLLERQFHITDYTVTDSHTIRLYEEIDQRAQINHRFTEQGLLITKIAIHEERLEDYFSDLIGGGDIG